LLKQNLGKLPIVAEDLGIITPEVEALRDKFGFPGMKILQFAFDSDRANPFLPFNYVNRNCIVYTGTHDNDTTVGWFNARSPEEQARVVDYLGCLCPDGIHWSLIRLALGSVANQAIFPFQDLLGLGNDARMNTPSVPDGNWGWRYRAEAVNSEVGEHLKYLTYLYGRAPY
jgi:4-alpha-glucanotransferase